MISYSNFGKVIFFSFMVFFILLTSIPAYAFDQKGESDPPPYTSEPQIYSKTLATGETVWHTDVNSGCSFSDHYINVEIDSEPDEIAGAKITLTAYDVDYNNSTGCSGGPEVDYLYINDNFIGQLQGANNSWSTNTFNVPSSYIISGTNEVYIDTDAPGTGCWCVGIGYAEISGKVGFQIVKHSPEKDEKNVKWDSPDITIDFSDNVKQSSANSNTIILDYRDQSGNWTTVNTAYSLPSSKRVNLTPSAKLKDGIRYRLRVLGGSNGVLNKNDSELNNPETWYFWTMVDLDGQTTNVFKPNTTKDKLQITWFNVSRNENLVPIKTVVNRIYSLWEPKSDVFDSDEVTEFKAKVTLTANGTNQVMNNYVIKRPDKYTANEKKLAKNTINFKRVGGSGAKEDYTLKIEPVPQKGTPKEFKKQDSATRTSNTPSLRFNAWACEMGAWYNGVNAGQLTSARAELGRGNDFAWSVFPIVGSSYDYKGTVAKGAGGFNMTYTASKYSDLWDDTVRFVTNNATGTEIEEMRHVMLHLATLKPATHRLIVGLVPSDGIPGANGVRWNHVLLLSESNFNAGTVAHEIGHEYGIAANTGAGCTDKHNNSPQTIEGFNVYANKNKSFTEGNSERDAVNLNDCNGSPVSTFVVPLMNKWGVDTNLRWIRPDNYKHVITSMGAATLSASEIQALTGDYMVVQGSIDGSGNVENVSPLYNITQRYIDAPSGTGYTAELFTDENGTGTSLGSYEFGTDEITIIKNDDSITTFDSEMFAFTIPFDDTAQSLVISGTNNTVVINKSDNGLSAPSVGFTNPVDSATIAGTVGVTWTGSDDGGNLYYRLEYSPDGSVWIPVSNQLYNTTTYSIDTTLLPTGGSQKLAIIAYDGFNTTREEIDITIYNSVGIKSTSPISNETDVSEGQTIAAYFVSPMDETTITDSTFVLYQSNTPVPGTVSYDSSANMATFTPDGKLASNTSYSARLIGGGSGIADINGNTLTSTYQWYFTTGETAANPQVESVSPDDGATDIPINALIQANFEDDLLSTSVTSSSFTLEDENGSPVLGTVSYNSTNMSAVFQPTSNLAADTVYTATLTTDITDPQANPLESDYLWSFTTTSTESSGVRIVNVAGDEVKDEDNDSLYDLLIIKVRIEVINTGTYNLNGQLKDSAGEVIGWTSASQYIYPAGVYVMELEFDGEDIASHGADGPYELANLSVAQSSITDNYTGTYTTYPYKSADFYSPIRFSSIPDIAVARNSSNEDVLNVEDYAFHVSENVADLTYRLLINSNEDVGVTLDDNHYIDIYPITQTVDTSVYPPITTTLPVTQTIGTTDITLEVKDSSSARALNTFSVTVVDAYELSSKGWYLLSLTSEPEDNSISSVLESIDGKYDKVWAYVNGAWKLYDPDNPEFSDLQELSAGQGFWILINEASALTTFGTDVDGDSVELIKGWNLAGINSKIPVSISQALDSIAGRYLSVWAYIGGEWKKYDPNNESNSDLKELIPGYGIWINAILDTTWSIQ